MTEITLNANQIEDHAGLLRSAVEQAGAPYEPGLNQSVPHPGYDEVAARCGMGNGPHFELAAGHGVLASYGGLRVLAGVHTKDGYALYVPGVILPDTAYGVRFGCLVASPDIVAPASLQDMLRRPLSDLQQLLLDDIAAKHMPTVGEHADRAVNMADVGHVALLAVTPPADAAGVHMAVHTYVAGGLSQRLAGSGTLDVHMGSAQRQVREVIIPAARASHIIVSRVHQLPGPVQTDPATLVAGVALAAIRSQRGSRAQPDIARNAWHMQAGGM